MMIATFRIVVSTLIIKILLLLLLLLLFLVSTSRTHGLEINTQQRTATLSASSSSPLPRSVTPFDPERWSHDPTTKTTAAINNNNNKHVEELDPTNDLRRHVSQRQETSPTSIIYSLYGSIVGGANGDLAAADDDANNTCPGHCRDKQGQKRGHCDNSDSKCHCYFGYSGDDCSILVSEYLGLRYRVTNFALSIIFSILLAFTIYATVVAVNRIVTTQFKRNKQNLCTLLCVTVCCTTRMVHCAIEALHLGETLPPLLTHIIFDLFYPALIFSYSLHLSVWIDIILSIRMFTRRTKRIVRTVIWIAIATIVLPTVAYSIASDLLYAFVPAGDTLLILYYAYICVVSLVLIFGFCGLGIVVINKMRKSKLVYNTISKAQLMVAANLLLVTLSLIFIVFTIILWLLLLPTAISAGPELYMVLLVFSRLAEALCMLLFIRVLFNVFRVYPISASSAISSSREAGGSSGSFQSRNPELFTSHQQQEAYMNDPLLNSMYPLEYFGVGVGVAVADGAAGGLVDPKNNYNKISFDTDTATYTYNTNKDKDKDKGNTHNNSSTCIINNYYNNAINYNNSNFGSNAAVMGTSSGELDGGEEEEEEEEGYYVTRYSPMIASSGGITSECRL